MPWVRIEDDYLANGKVAKLSPHARLLDLCGIIHSARELRDGYLTADEVKAIAVTIRVRRWEPAAAELVSVNRWRVERDGWMIHDYLRYQPSRERVLAQREADRQRKRGAAGIRWKSGRTPDAPGPGPGRTLDRSSSSSSPGKGGAGGEGAHRSQPAAAAARFGSQTTGDEIDHGRS
jgi:hypothetical protein